VNIADTALLYADRGMPVFPLNGKKPLTENGFLDASKDATKVRTWWSKWPTANIGIPTGRASRHFVLDVDPRHKGDKSLAEMEKKHGSLPTTLEALTGGGGRHLYFAIRGQRNAALASLAGTMRRRGCTTKAIEAALLVKNAARCQPPLMEDEVSAIAASISRYEPGDILSARSKESVRAERILHFATAAQIAESTSASVDWIARPWVAAGSITELDAKVKLGKTTFIRNWFERCWMVRRFWENLL
jgi:hypothetical protein